MVLFRRRRAFLWVAGFVFALALLHAIFGTKYQANMKVLVRRGRADAPLSAGENAPLDLTRMEITEEELNSEVELLRGNDVLRKVVEETGVGGRDWFHFVRLNEGQPQLMERAARSLGRKLKVAPVKKTNLIAISYAADSPATAQKILESLANAYLEKHTTVHRAGGEVSFFEQQISDSRRELEDSKLRLLQFNASHGAVAAALQRDLAVQKLTDVDAAARQTRIELSETQQRLVELQSLLTTLPERSTTQVRKADNPELLKSLKASLLDLDLKRTQLLTKYEPSHRLVQEIEQQIAEARSTIALEQGTPVRDETTDKDTHFEWAKLELEKAQVQQKALQARELACSAEARAYRTSAEHLAGDALAQEELASSEKAALENYLLYVKKQDEARMHQALDERGIVNVAIAEQPVAPALPVVPVPVVVMVGFVAALASGTGAAFAADHLDPSFRDPHDVIAYLDVPVLASLPRQERRLLP